MLDIIITNVSIGVSQTKRALLHEIPQVVAELCDSSDETQNTAEL